MTTSSFSFIPCVSFLPFFFYRIFNFRIMLTFYFSISLYLVSLRTFNSFLFLSLFCTVTFSYSPLPLTFLRLAPITMFSICLYLIRFLYRFLILSSFAAFPDFFHTLILFLSLSNCSSLPTVPSLSH